MNNVFVQGVLYLVKGYGVGQEEKYKIDFQYKCLQQ